MNLLIDGDILVYRFAHSNTVAFDWDGDGDKDAVVELPEEAIEDVEAYIQMLLKVTECDVPFVCLSSKTNFRYTVEPTYKHNRKGTKPPALTKVIRRYLEETYQTRSKPDLEADDIMGILQTRNPDKFKMATIDKDLLQIPGFCYNWNHRKMHFTSLFNADKMFYRQILMGDSTDGYKGCPGVGPVGADKMLNETPSPYWWKEIVAMYKAKGLTEKHAITQARLARILRASDYDFEKKEVILWTP
jgi:DNA polymerase-1